MREKIAEIVCPSAGSGRKCSECDVKCQYRFELDRLLALFTAEQAAELQAMREALRTARDYVEDASNGKMGKHLVSMATKDLEEINKILGDRNG